MSWNFLYIIELPQIRFLDDLLTKQGWNFSLASNLPCSQVLKSPWTVLVSNNNNLFRVFMTPPFGHNYCKCGVKWMCKTWICITLFICWFIPSLLWNLEEGCFSRTAYFPFSIDSKIDLFHSSVFLSEILILLLLENGKCAVLEKHWPSFKI